MYVLRPSVSLMPLQQPYYIWRETLLITMPYNRGKETVKHLAGHHAKVYLAARSEAKADVAIADIQKAVPNADIKFLKLDMMDLASVAASAKDFLRYSPSYSNCLVMEPA